MYRKPKAQGALEYLLLIGGALIVTAVVVVLATTVMGSGKEATNAAGDAAINVLEEGISGIDGGAPMAASLDDIQNSPGSSFDLAGGNVDLSAGSVDFQIIGDMPDTLVAELRSDPITFTIDKSQCTSTTDAATGITYTSCKISIPQESLKSLNEGLHSLTLTDPASAENTASASFTVGTTATTAPPAPTGLSVALASPGFTTVNLSWNVVPEITGYKVYRAAASGGPYIHLPGISIISAGPQGPVAATDPDLPTGTYYYKVSAYNAAGESAKSSYASITVLATLPAVPSNLTATAVSSSQIDLNWTDNASNETGFAISRSSDGGVTWGQMSGPLLAANTTYYVNEGLMAGITYYYKIRAVNAAGGSAFSNIASATTPTQGLILTASNITSSSATLSWNAITGATAYAIFKTASPCSSDVYNPENQVESVTAITKAYAGLTPNTTYCYGVKATDGTQFITQSTPISVTTLALPGSPIAPSNLTATAISSSQINLIWADNSSNETNFALTRSTDQINWGLAFSVGGSNTTSYTDNGRISDKTYYYKVKAYNTLGGSAFSNIASATTTNQFWWDGNSFYWLNQLQGCTSKAIYFIRADGSIRKTLVLSENEHQYCPSFADWNTAVLKCNGSNSGAPIYKLTAPKVSQCFDSDYGNNYSQFGFVKEATDARTDDYCDSAVLVEAKCLNNALVQERYACPNGCDSGICIKANTDPWAQISISNGTISWQAIQRSSGGAVQLSFTKDNGCNRLAMVASASGGSYKPFFTDWHSAVLKQYAAGRGYVDVSKTLLKNPPSQPTSTGT